MSTINAPPSLAADQVRATAAAARISIVVAHAPTPPAASRREIEAGRQAVKQAEAAAEAAVKQLQEHQRAARERGIVV